MSLFKWKKKEVVSSTKLEEEAKLLANYLLKESRIIYTFGNGGSASIAEHMACDWMKGSKGKLKVISLSSNGPLLSAISNDLGYENTCRSQLEWLVNPTKDIVILISSSGTSPNILHAADYCALSKTVCISFTGFNRTIHNTISFGVVDSQDYGIIEDYHSQLMHAVARRLRNG